MSIFRFDSISMLRDREQAMVGDSDWMQRPFRTIGALTDPVNETVNSCFV